MLHSTPPPSAAAQHRLEHWVHWSLLLGLIVSGLLLLAGLVISLDRGERRPNAPPPPVSTIVHNALHARGPDLIELGLLALIGTPALRVLVLAVGWLAEKQYRFALVALTVFALLGLSLVLGLG